VGTTSFMYRLFLLLHILSAIVGFGGVMLNGVYAARARKRPPAESLAVMEVNTFVSVTVAEKAIWLVPIFGFGLVGLSDEVYKFSQTWVWLSIIVYVAALAVSYLLMQPRVKEVLALQREMVSQGPTHGPPPQAAQLGALGKQIAPIGVVLDLALLVILVLMIWKPGL
jgi:uncharacterized membrane protein